MSVDFDPTTTASNLATAEDPTWEVALLFPSKGEWTEEEYLAIDARGGRLIELSDGHLEVMPLPSLAHQLLVLFLAESLKAFIQSQKIAGIVVISPMPVRLWSGKIREPDVMFFKPERTTNPDEPPDGCDLVVEILSRSKKDRDRDLVTKRDEYAKAKIPEYWLIDPQNSSITILTLKKNKYKLLGEFKSGERATSLFLAGFGLDVDAVFAAAAM